MLFNSRGRTEVDALIYAAAQIPGPKYNLRENTKLTQGGKFNISRPKSSLEWVEHRARQLPGPGQYSPRHNDFPRGGRFSLAKPKSDVEVAIRAASQIPGPGSYEPLTCDWGKGGFSMYGKMTYGNSQTTLPDAIRYRQTTLPASAASTYRRDSSCSRQIISTKPSSPSVRFAGKTFTEAERERKWRDRLVKERDEKFLKLERQRALSSFDPFELRKEKRRGKMKEEAEWKRAALAAGGKIVGGAATATAEARAGALALLRGEARSSPRSRKGNVSRRSVHTSRSSIISSRRSISGKSDEGNRQTTSVQSKRELFMRYYGYAPSSLVQEKQPNHSNNQKTDQKKKRKKKRPTTNRRRYDSKQYSLPERPTTSRSFMRARKVDPRIAPIESRVGPGDYDVINAEKHSSKFSGYG